MIRCATAQDKSKRGRIFSPCRSLMFIGIGVSLVLAACGSPTGPAMPAAPAQSTALSLPTPRPCSVPTGCCGRHTTWSALPTGLRTSVNAPSLSSRASLPKLATPIASSGNARETAPESIVSVHRQFVSLADGGGDRQCPLPGMASILRGGAPVRLHPSHGNSGPAWDGQRS